VAEAIGTDPAVRDAVQRVTGTLEFVLDHRIDGMAFGKVVRSTVPHGRLIGVQTDEALREPGVITVITGADIQQDPGIHEYYGAQRADQPVLAIGKVRYAGEPIAIVIAESQHQAERAAELVYGEYEELAYVTSEVQARQPGAPVIHEEWPDNGCGQWRLEHGDIDSGMRRADRIYSATYHSPAASHVPMEPFVGVAHWQDGKLEIWTSSQSPYAVHTGMRAMFSLPADAVRVRTLNVGGGYGSKGQMRIEPMVACAARIAGCPVRIELARDEVFYTIGKHAATVDISTGVLRDGTIIARRISINYNAGAYAVTSPGGAGQGLSRAPGPYVVPNVRVDSVATYTNTVPTGPFRGAMTSQIAFAYESESDRIARDLGIDPLEFRRRNLLRKGDLYPTGEALKDLHYDDLLDDLADAIEWRTPPGSSGPDIKRGKGLAVIIKNTLTPSRSEAYLALRRDGQIEIRCSSVEMGQGAAITLVQIAADALGVSPDRLVIGFPDTDVTPFDTTTSSSRTTSSMSAALQSAAIDLLDQLARRAAARWGVDPQGIDHRDGVVVEGAKPGRRAPWASLLVPDEAELVGHGVFHSTFGLSQMDPMKVHGPVSVHWHQGGAAAEVEVDTETGVVRVLRLHANCYAGHAVSPLRVLKQNQGCAVWGLGPAMFEELQYHDGAVSNPNLSGYLIPSIMDVPEDLTGTAIESSDAFAELHGVGEMAAPAIAPAIANAIFAATGARVTDLPLSPERVLAALDAARESEQRGSA